VAQHAKRIGGGARVGVLRVGGGQGLAAEAGYGGGAAGQGGQSEASAECRGGAGAGHAAEPGLCDLSVCGAAPEFFQGPVSLVYK
jgi:hypothetical protein